MHESVYGPKLPRLRATVASAFGGIAAATPVAANDPKRTSLHCSAFAPILYLEGLRKPREAFWGSQASVNCAIIPLQGLN